MEILFALCLLSIIALIICKKEVLDFIKRKKLTRTDKSDRDLRK